MVCQQGYDWMANSVNLNPFMPMVFPPSINWTSQFPILGLLGGVFHFYSNFKRNFCKQTVENLIRGCVLRRLIRFCPVCPCPTKRMRGLYGFIRTIAKSANPDHTAPV